MPLLMIVGDIAHLTDKEVTQIKKYVELDTILDVQFKDASGEVMIPTGVIPEVLAVDGSVTSNAYVTVIKNGSIVKAEVTEKLPAPVIKGTTPYELSTKATMPSSSSSVTSMCFLTAIMKDTASSILRLITSTACRSG